MQLIPLILALGAATLTASAPASCDIAIECSNGNTYTGCDAVAQCEAAGGSWPSIPVERNVREAQRACTLIVFCSNGMTYQGCSALKDCLNNGGVSCPSSGCETV